MHSDLSDLLAPLSIDDEIKGVTLLDKINALQRELRRQEKAYRKRDNAGQSPLLKAAHRMQIMRAILNDYYKLAGLSTY